MRIVHIAAVCAAGLPLAAGVELDVNDPQSIIQAAKAIATNLMSYETTLAPGSIDTGILPYPPYFWWESGGVWGGMVDYWAYTGDKTWEQDAANAFYAQSGPNQDLIMPSQAFDEGNDDQGFWALSVATAFEYKLPSADGLSYPEVAAKVFEELVSRWVTVGSETCGGGLKWQFYTSNLGYDYKSSVTQGAFFQLAARLAHFTGNATYAEWATKVWDWTTNVGLIDSSCRVFDGTSDLTDCKDIVRLQWTYNNGLFMYGAANMYSVTGNSMWEQRVHGLLSLAQYDFFGPYKNTTGVMYEVACEQYGTCGVDQFSFKAYLARWMAKSTVLVPSISNQVWSLLETSAKAAAQSCVGGTDKTTCGEKWWVRGFDGSYGVGQQLSALEVIQALLVKFGRAPPLKNGNVKVTAPTSYPQKPTVPVVAPIPTVKIVTQPERVGPQTIQTPERYSPNFAAQATPAIPAQAAALGVFALAGAALL